MRGSFFSFSLSWLVELKEGLPTFPRLGYAQTSHASQGRTVDVALLLVDSPTDSRGIYTPMTRGREANHAYVITEDRRSALDVLTKTLARDWIDEPALSRKARLDQNGSRLEARNIPWDEMESEELKRRSLQVVAERNRQNNRVERFLSIGL